MMRKDLLLVVGAYLSFGVLPLFWALLGSVEPTVLALHRTVWAMVFLGGVLFVRGELLTALRKLQNRRYLMGIVVSGGLLATNWVGYLIALQHGDILSASLAYYIAPLMTFVGAFFIFGERLDLVKKVSLLFLVVGVTVPVLITGKLPLMALLIGGSWVGYTLVRRKFAVAPVEGLFHETVVLSALIAIGAPFFYGASLSALTGLSSTTWLLLLATGPVTALPLLALVSGMRGVPMQVVGITQYVTPSMKLLLSVVYFGVYPSATQLSGLGFIWLGIAVFFLGNAVTVHRLPTQPVPEISSVSPGN
jgi:chloramphenicol-sensitive protein RarD